MSVLYPERAFYQDDGGRVHVSDFFQVFLNPIFEIFFYTLALVTATLGSVYATDIKARISGTNENVNLDLVILLALVTTLFYAAQRWATLIQKEAVSRSTENVRKELLESSNELKEFVRTMPPESFLEVVGRLHVRADNLLRVLLDSSVPVQQETIRFALRTVLDYIAEAARTFDDKTTERYHANIMIYHPPTEFSEAETADRLQKRLVFERDATSIQLSQGVLDLRTDLAIRTSNEAGAEPKMDLSLSPFLLAIPNLIREPDGDRRFYTLPGAPLAWARKSADQYSDVDALLGWYQNECVPDAAVASQMRAYFNGEDSGIGSFAAYALVFNEQNYIQQRDEAVHVDESVYDLTLDEDGSEVPIGVLNIHRASAGILRGDSKAGPYFMRATRPLRVICTHLLYLLRKTEQEQYGIWENLLPDEHQLSDEHQDAPFASSEETKASVHDDKRKGSDLKER